MGTQTGRVRLAGVSNHGGYPPGVPCWIDVAEPDPTAAAAFYADLFGWSFEDHRSETPDAAYRVARLAGRAVAAIGPAPAAGAAPAWMTYIGVASADETVAAVRAAGGTVEIEPYDVPDEGRTAGCADPAGAPFGLWQPGRMTGAELVNAPGTWNWSDLHTPDVEAARAFYGAVFGWEAAEVALGPGPPQWLWRRPGYADFLEATRDPGIRARHAAIGAPEGFSDAVGWLVPAEGPARWKVTFAVDDTDGVARRAAAGGGAVVQEPFAAGPVRLAELTDPWGAGLTVSHYAPG
jgi:predicted enzyme related to lactoylglutathione lyase